MSPLIGETGFRRKGLFVRRGIAIRTTETSGSRLVTQFLGSIIALDGFRDDGAGGVTFGEILRFGLHHSGDVATRQGNAAHAE